MRKVIRVFGAILFLCIILISCSESKKSTEEENVLKSLINIQNSLETNVSYDNFVELLRNAKTELDSLKQAEKKNSCFLAAVDKCYASYEIARKAWKQKTETENEKKQQDMEMTLSFSLSFASLSIEKARYCYK